MKNTEYLQILMSYWGHRVSFEKQKNGFIGLYRGDDKRPLYIGDSIDDVINKVRLSIGDMLIKEVVKNIK